MQSACPSWNSGISSKIRKLNFFSVFFSIERERTELDCIRDNLGIYFFFFCVCLKNGPQILLMLRACLSLSGWTGFLFPWMNLIFKNLLSCSDTKELVFLFHSLQEYFKKISKLEIVWDLKMSSYLATREFTLMLMSSCNSFLLLLNNNCEQLTKFSAKFFNRLSVLSFLLPNFVFPLCIKLLVPSFTPSEPIKRYIYCWG